VCCISHLPDIFWKICKHDLQLLLDCLKRGLPKVPAISPFWGAPV